MMLITGYIHGISLKKKIRKFIIKQKNSTAPTDQSLSDTVLDKPTKIVSIVIIALCSYFSQETILNKGVLLWQQLKNAMAHTV